MKGTKKTKPRFTYLNLSAQADTLQRDLLQTYCLCALGGAVATEVERLLFRWDSHYGSINKAQFHDSCIVPSQTGSVMQPDAR